MKRNRLLFILALIVIGAAGLAIRIPGLGHLSGDMIDCYLPWYDSVPAHQGIGVLQNYDGDYGLPYATVLWLLHYIPGTALIKIKMVSVVFEYMTALSVGLLASYFFEDRKKYIVFAVGFGLTILYPALAMNGAYWGQCDGVYAGFVILMIYALLKGKPVPAMIFLGFAVTSKLQTIFIIPFLLLYWYRRRNFSLLYLLIVPVVVEILYIPGMLAGYSPLAPITMYLAQTSEYPQMYMHYPNLWCYFWQIADYDMFQLPVIGWVAGCLALMLAFLMLKGRDLDDRTWISIALWSSLFPVHFLPAMHERYSMIAELVAVVYAILYPKRAWTSAFLWLTISWAIYQPMMMDRFPEQEKTAIGMMFVMIALTVFTVSDVHKDGRSVRVIPEGSGRLAEGGGYKEGENSSAGCVRLTALERRILDVFDKYGIWPVVLAVMGIFAFSAYKAFLYTAPDYLDNVNENLALPMTAMYRFIAMAVSGISGGVLSEASAVKMLSLILFPVAAFMWAHVSFEISGANRQSVNKEVKDGADADLIRRCIFVIAFMILPATAFSPVILESADGICLVLSGTGIILSRRSRIASYLLLGLAASISPVYLIFNAAVIILKCVNDKDAKFPEALKTSAIASGVSALIMAATSLIGLVAGIPAGDSFRALFCGFILQGALFFVLSVLLLILCVRDYRYIIPVLLFEYGLTMDFGRYVGAIREKYYVLIPAMVILSVLNVICIEYVRRGRKKRD